MHDNIRLRFFYSVSFRSIIDGILIDYRYQIIPVMVSFFCSIVRVPLTFTLAWWCGGVGLIIIGRVPFVVISFSFDH